MGTIASAKYFLNSSAIPVSTDAKGNRLEGTDADGLAIENIAP
jgi:hypothetical protein